MFNDLSDDAGGWVCTGGPTSCSGGALVLPRCCCSQQAPRRRAVKRCTLDCFGDRHRRVIEGVFKRCAANEASGFQLELLGGQRRTVCEKTNHNTTTLKKMFLCLLDTRGLLLLCAASLVASTDHVLLLQGRMFAYLLATCRYSVGQARQQCTSQCTKLCSSVGQAREQQRCYR